MVRVIGRFEKLRDREIRILLYYINTELGYARRDLCPIAYGGVVLQRWRAIARQHTILYNRAKSTKSVGCKIGDMRSRLRFLYPGIPGCL